MKLLPSILVCGFVIGVFATARAASDRPNIIVILADDMGWSDISCYGSEIPTPNLDALAKNGLRFTQFYNTGRCCPTRASLLTGLYPHQAGVGHMTEEHTGPDGKVLPGYSGRLNDQCVTMAEVLKGAGYFTAMAGKWHVGQNLGVTPTGRGFDRALHAPAGGFYFHDSPRTALFLNGKSVGRNDDPLPKEWYATDLWSDYGLKFIDEARAAKKPFFLYMAENAPHFPLQAPAETIAKWRGKFAAGWDRLREERYKRQVEMGLIDKAWPMSPRAEGVPAWDSLTSEQKDRYEHMMAIYAAVLERMDTAIGRVVAGLKERGELDNTLILFMSDNGGNAESGVPGRLQGANPGDAKSDVFVGECWAGLNNTPFVRYKHFTDEGGISTPLIAHWPKKIGAERVGQLEKQPAHLIDIMATVVDVGGATYPKEVNGKAIKPFEGVSLQPAFNAKSIERKQPIFWEHEGNRAIRDGDWKLVALEDKPWRLYNLKDDRTEQKDLAKDQPDRVAAMEKQWNEWAARANVLPLGGWKAGPAKNAKKAGKGSKRNSFALSAGDHLDNTDAPAVANRGFAISAKFDSNRPNGVLLAQGGVARGYALYLKDGKLTFMVRRSATDVATVATPEAVTGKHQVLARLEPDGRMTLSLDGKEVANSKAEGPLPSMPLDGLDVGADQGGLVGPYGETNEFSGTLEAVTVELTAK
jgi:arylsulfatase